MAIGLPVTVENEKKSANHHLGCKPPSCNVMRSAVEISSRLKLSQRYVETRLNSENASEPLWGTLAMSMIEWYSGRLGVEVMMISPLEFSWNTQRNMFDWSDDRKTTCSSLRLFIRATKKVKFLFKWAFLYFSWWFLFLTISISGFYNRATSQTSQSAPKKSWFWGKKRQLSRVICFRHNDMQDCFIKLGKWYQTAVVEACGRFFCTLFRGSSRKPTRSSCFLIASILWICHIIHGL